MDYTALFLILILTTTQTTPLHHHCNSDVYSSASGLQELTTLQYCLIDNCTIIRNDTGQQLDIVYTTQSHLVVTPTDGQTSTMLISKNDPELFCSSLNTTDDANILIAAGAVTLLLSSLFSGSIAVLLLLFKELRNAFGKLMIIHSIAASLATFFVFIILIMHKSIAVHSITPCYLTYFAFMQSSMISEGSATCIIAYLAYVMRQSCKSIEVKKVRNKQFYENSMKYIFGSLLLFDILIFSYDFGTATFQHVVLPNGHCSFNDQLENDAVKIAQANNVLNKISQIILLLVYFVYYYKLNKMLRLVRTLAVKVDHQQNRLYFKLAITMAATIGIAQFFLTYTRLISPTAFARIVGGLSVPAQRCVILILLTSSKKVLRLCKERFCTTGTSSYMTDMTEQ